MLLTALERSLTRLLQERSCKKYNGYLKRTYICSGSNLSDISDGGDTNFIYI